MSNPSEWKCTVCHGSGISMLLGHISVCYECNGDRLFRYRCEDCTYGYVAGEPGILDRLCGRSASKRRCPTCKGHTSMLPEDEPQAHREAREKRARKWAQDMVDLYAPGVMAREAGR